MNPSAAQPTLPPIAGSLKRPASRGRQFLWCVIVWVVAWSPALLLGLLVHRNAVNHLFLDDWERVPIIEKYREGTLAFSDLYAPHINHRMVLPRVLMLVANETSRGDVRVEIALIFFSALASALGVFILLRRTCGTSMLPLAGLTLLCNLAIFSPMQWENWLWAVQLAMVLPMPLVVWSLVVVRNRWSWWARAVVCVTLGLLATHSFGHGFVVWLALIFAAAADHGAFSSRQSRFAFLATCLSVATIALTCYFLLDYRNSSHPSHAFGVAVGERPPAFLMREESFPISQFLGFVSVLAGNLFSRWPYIDHLPLAGSLGAALIMGVGLIATSLFWSRRAGDTQWWDRAVPWFALAGAALAALCALAIGRLGFERSLVRALTSRYLAMSLYLTVAAIPLAWIWSRHWLSRRPAFATPMRSLISFGMGAACLLSLPAWSYGAAMMQLTSHNFLQGKAQLLFYKHFDMVEPARRIDFNPDFFLPQVRTLEKYRLLRPPPIDSLNLDRFKLSNNPRPLSQAQVTHLTTSPSGSLEFQGIGALPDRPADLILVTAGDHPSAHHIIGIGLENADALRHPFPRHDLSHTGKRGRPNPFATAWTALVPAHHLNHLPPDATLCLWLLDLRKMRAHRIDGTWKRDSHGQITRM